jgi:hypothetical protein
LSPYPTTDGSKSIDNTAPVVFQDVLTAPDGGERWSGTHTITWNNTDISDDNLAASPIILYYSNDGGTTWTLIASGEANDGSYPGWNTALLSDGTNYKVNVTAVDQAGNYGYDISNATFIIDNNAPTCTIAYNRSATYFKSGTKLKIYANFSEGGGLNETVNISISTIGNGDLANVTMTKTDNTHYYYGWTVPAGSDDDGTFTAQIWAHDNASNYLSPYPTTDATKKIDNTAPTATIAYNRSATYFKEGDTLKVYANFTEAGSGMSPTSITINIATAGNGDLANITMSQTDNTHWYYGWTVPAGSDDDGTFTVSVYAQDNATNLLGTYPTTSATKKIDNTAPTAAIEYNRSATYYTASTALKIYANFTEAGSGINPTSVTINIATAGNGDLANITMTQTDNTHWYYGWTVPAGSDDDGTFTVSIYAQDNVTNYLSPYPKTSATKKIDNTAPTCAIAYNRSATYFKAGVALKIYANFTEGGSGIDETSLNINIDTAGNGDLANTSLSRTDNTHWYYNWAIPAGSDDDGTFTVKIWGRDNMSINLNPYPTTSATKNIDNTAPVGTITYNNSRLYFKAGEALKIYANFTEAGSGMNEAVMIKINTTAGNGNLSNTSMTKTDNTHYYYGWTIPSGSDDNGAFTVKIYAADNASNNLVSYPTTSSSKSIDNTVPTAIIAYNRSATYFNAGTALKIYANMTESGGSGMNEAVTINIAAAGNGDLANTTMTKTDNTHYYYGWTIPSGSDDDGTFTISVYAQDNATNLLGTYPTTSTSKKIDNTAPTCTVAYNRSASYFKAGVALKIYANFTEGGSGIDETSITINIETVGNGDLANQSMTKTDNTHWYYGWTVPAGSDDDGTFTVKIWGKDNVSIYLDPYPTTSATKSIDNTAPTGTITAPTSGGYYDTLTNITGTTADGGSGVSTVTITYYNATNQKYWNGTAWGAGATNLAVTGSTSWYKNSQLPTLSNGKTYIINLSVIDVAANSNTAAHSHTFYFDTSGPTISVVVITDVSISSTTYVKDGDTVNITATVSDANLGTGDTSYIHADLSGFSLGTEVEADGYNGDTDIAYWNISSVTCDPSDGEIVVWINASDIAGNYATEVNGTTTADNTAPALSYAVFDADNNGNTYTYVDVYCSESTMDWTSAATTDFDISTSGVTVSEVTSSSGARVTIKLSAKLDGGGPTINLTGDGIQDLAGNNATALAVTISTYRIAFSEGWNLFSIPGDVSSISIPTLLGSIWSNADRTTNVWWYNASADNWKYYSVRTQTGTLSEIEPGRAYWIHMNASDTLIGNYSTVLHGINPAPIVELTGHRWNMIGHWATYNQTANTTGGLASLSDVLAETGEILYKYTPAGGFVNIYGSATTKMQPGDGFWLYLKTSSTGYYTLAES